METVGDFASGATHAGIDAGEVDRDVGLVDGTRVEEVVDQTELVEAPLIVGAGPVLKRVPDRADAADVVSDPGGGVLEGHRVASLDMGANLRAKTQVETTAARALQVPGDEGRGKRAAPKGNGDVGADLQPRGGGGSEGEGKKGIVGSLEGPNAVEAELLKALSSGGDIAQGNIGHLCVELHEPLVSQIPDDRSRATTRYTAAAHGRGWDEESDRRRSTRLGTGASNIRAPQVRENRRIG